MIPHSSNTDFKCKVCENGVNNHGRSRSYDRAFYQPGYEIDLRNGYISSACRRYSSNMSCRPQSDSLMSTDEFDQRFTINRTCHETNSEPGDRHKYIHKSYSKATTPFLAEYPGRGRTMSQDELTSSTTRHTFQPKRFVLEQSITIDRQCTQTEDNNQQLRQQVNSLYRLFNILEDRNQELKTRVNDLTVKNEQLQQQSNNIDRRCNELEATNQNLAIQVNDLTVKNEQLQQQANNIDDKCNQLEVTNQNLGTQVNNLNEECKLLKAGKENLQKQICDLDQQLKTHDSQFNEIWMRIGKYDWRVDVCISTDG